MAPSGPRSTFAQAVVPVLAGIVVLGVLALALWGIAAWASHNAGSGKLDVNLGDDFFNAGSARKRAAEIGERGPALFPGLLKADEGYIVLAHVGTDPLNGWRAFSAVREGVDVRCAVQWQPDTNKFVDPCTKTTYPADGQGLPQFEVLLNTKQELLVDLTPGGNPGQGPAPTTTTA